MKAFRIAAAGAVSSLVLGFGATVAQAGGYSKWPIGPGYGPGPGMAPYPGATCAPMRRGVPMYRPPYYGPMGPAAQRPLMAPQGAQKRTLVAGMAAAPASKDTVVDQAEVVISQMRFDQPTITVKKGGSVTWRNQGPMPHTVTANDGGFGSQTLQAGGNYSRTFDEVGTFGYYCSLHPSMQGKVVVVE